MRLNRVTSGVRSGSQPLGPTLARKKFCLQMPCYLLLSHAGVHNKISIRNIPNSEQTRHVYKVHAGS